MFDRPTLRGPGSRSCVLGRRGRRRWRLGGIAGRRRAPVRGYRDRRDRHVIRGHGDGADAVGDVPRARRIAWRALAGASRHGPERRPGRPHRWWRRHAVTGAIDASCHRPCPFRGRGDACLDGHRRQRYSLRAAGATAAQEIAFAIRSAVEYIEQGVAAGLDVDVMAPRLVLHLSAGDDVCEEIAKYRAARRLWARVMRDRFGARDARSWAAADPRADGDVTARRSAVRSCRARHAPGPDRGRRRRERGAGERVR